MKTTVCILYHSGCLDGYASAAWAAKNLSEVGRPPSEILLKPCTYNSTKDDAATLEFLRAVEPSTFSAIYIVDFSFPRPMLDTLRTFAPVTLIDHHQTAFEMLSCPVNYSPNYAITKTIHDPDNARYPLTLRLDNTCCGCLGVHAYFNGPDDKPPMFLRFIDDRDRWKFVYGNTKPYCAAAYLIPQTPTFEGTRTWVFNAQETDRLYSEGLAIMKYQDHCIKSMMRNVRFTTCQIGEYDSPELKVAVINHGMGAMSSELGAYILEQHPEVDYAVIWHMAEKDRIECSLRSKKPDVDVSHIAKRLGGGGHAGAAGCVMPLDYFTRCFLRG